MQSKINKHLAQSFFEALSKAFKGEDAYIDSFLSEDVRWWLPNSIENLTGVSRVLCGRSEVMEALNSVKNVYVLETTAFKFHSWVAENDLVALRFSLSAIMATGKLYENQYQSTIRCSSGMIVEIWESFDTAYLANMLYR
jgi:ketosteroid isomerase-like protein